MIWPAYWAVLKNEKISPINLDIAKPVVSKFITEKMLSLTGDWPALAAQDVKKILKSLADQKLVDGEPVYICGGKLYQLNNAGQLSKQENPAAAPYLWPIAHDIRPAAQSLGVRKCQDCHDTAQPFFFGKVEVDTPIVTDRKASTMIEFQQLSPFYTKIFAMSFMFRPWLKILTLASCALISAVLLLFGLKALAFVTKKLSDKD
jgi:hypothetical protein